MRRVRALRDVARAQLALLAAQWRVWRRPTGELTTVTAPSPVGVPRSPMPPDAWRLAVAVRRAAAYGVFRPQCLVRSMALQRLLERDGIEGGRLVVGVRRRSGEFAAHAWVELQGRPLGEDALQRRQFLRIADLPPQ